MSGKSWEALTVGGMAALWVGPAWYMGYAGGSYWWLWFWLSVILLVGAFEGVSVWRTGKTISQTFWRFSKANRTAAIAVLVAWTLGWLGLMWHLAVKMMGDA